jgi:phosphoribosylaminoimidazole carboxylase
LAARILGTADQGIRERVEAYMVESEREVREKDGRLVEMGAEVYQKEILKK